MGLDNSIEVKRTEYSKNIPELQKFIDPWDEKYGYNFSICYWRKCWNVRGAIFDVTDPKPMDNCICELNKDEIDRIIDVLGKFNADNWNDDLGSIWGWDDVEDKMQQDIENLQELRQLMDKYNLEVIFVDSY